MMPVATCLATIVGVVLMGWRYLLTFISWSVRTIFRTRAASQTAEVQPEVISLRAFAQHHVKPEAQRQDESTKQSVRRAA
jgi:hypothetical protein